MKIASMIYHDTNIIRPTAKCVVHIFSTRIIAPPSFQN